MLHSLLRVFHANDGQHGAKGLQVRRVGEPGGRERVSESHRAAGKAMPPRLEAQSMFNDSGGQHPHQPNARGRLPPLRPSYLQHSAHLLPGQAHVGDHIVHHHRPDEAASLANYPRKLAPHAQLTSSQARRMSGVTLSTTTGQMRLPSRRKGPVHSVAPLASASRT